MDPTLEPYPYLPPAQLARLHLLPEQLEPVAAILYEEFNELQELRGDFAKTPSRRDRFFLVCEARWIREEADNEIEELLNDAQQPAWEEIRQERRAALRDELQRHATYPPFH